MQNGVINVNFMGAGECVQKCLYKKNYKCYFLQKIIFNTKL